MVVLSLAMPAFARAAASTARPLGPKPQLLLFHGGSFLFDDGSFRAGTREAALGAGFVPHYVSYPLGDLPASVLAARAEARRLRQEFGQDVYAYGSSAGGTLAALLAGDGLVSAAVAKAPVSDLVGWEWPLSAYGADYYQRIGVGPPARHRLSPLRRPAESPLLVYQGRGDGIVPLAMNEAFTAKFRRVHLWVVPGGHATERRRPRLLRRALGWLADTAERQARAAAR